MEALRPLNIVVNAFTALILARLGVRSSFPD